MKNEQTESIACVCNGRYRNRKLTAWRMMCALTVVMLLLLFCIAGVSGSFHFLIAYGVFFVVFILSAGMCIYYRRIYRTISITLSGNHVIYVNTQGNSETYLLEELEKVKVKIGSRGQGYLFYFRNNKVMVYDGDNLVCLLIRLQSLGKYEKG